MQKVLHDRCMPFKITVSVDVFYSKFNMAQLRKADQQVKDGKVVIKTMEELETMEIE